MEYRRRLVVEIEIDFYLHLTYYFTNVYIYLEMISFNCNIFEFKFVQVLTRIVYTKTGIISLIRYLIGKLFNSKHYVK